MDNPNVLIIVAAVALVLLIYVIRYIISRVVDKGADAIENKIRQVHSEKHPAENQSLAERLGLQDRIPKLFRLKAVLPQPDSNSLLQLYRIAIVRFPSAPSAVRS